MYVCATVHLAVRWYWVRQAFIVFGDTAEEILASFMNERYRWMWGISGVSASLSIIIADCVLIWRCWVIWSKNWWVVALPLVSFVAGLVFDGFFLWQDIGHSVENAHLNWGLAAVNWGVAYFSTSLATTLICTSLIVFRISTVGHGAGYAVSLKSYKGIIEIVVESAALYAVSLIIFMAFLARDDPRNVYPQAILISSSGIAPTLIVARVASGQARPDDSWTSGSSITSGSLTFARYGSHQQMDIPLSITMHQDYVTDALSLEVGKLETKHAPTTSRDGTIRNASV
ncbi:hypothetical protein CPB85DRAFT_84744 [Mucidula mucida]|nr:hypothetical protein CPB85DRAFT_84744 [Mucidula mucida]